MNTQNKITNTTNKNQNKGKGGDSAAIMGTIFPEGVLMDILERLPVKPLLKFKCVSKSFCALISSPYFIRRHLNYNIQKNNLGIIFYDCQKKEGTYEYEVSSMFSRLCLSLPSQTVCEFDRLLNRTDDSVVYPNYSIGSLCCCHGMVCISFFQTSFAHEEILSGGAKEEIFFIWNPETKEHKQIPSGEFLSTDLGLYGFGFGATTEDYKLVRLVDINDGKTCSEGEIYMLRSNSWKTIQNITYRPSKCGKQPPGVFVNGALYWIADNIWYSKVIVRFDIDNESFMEEPLPDVCIRHKKLSIEEEDNDEFNVSVGVIQGRLCLVSHAFNVHADVWVMEEYDSWTKCFSINTATVTANWCLRLIRSFSNYDVLLQGDGCLVIYDPNSKQGRKVSITYDGESKTRELERLIAAESYVPSLVSPDC